MSKKINNMLQFVKNMGLVGKMTWAITLILIIPTAVICIFYYSAFRTSLLSEAKTRMGEELITIENTMNANLDTAESIIEGMDYRQEFPYFLDANNELTADEVAYYVTSVQNEMVDIRILYSDLVFQTIVHSSNTQAQERELAKDWQVELETLQRADYYEEIETISSGSDMTARKKDAKADIGYGQVREAEFAMSELLQQKLKAKEIVQYGTTILPIYKKFYSISRGEFVGALELNIAVNKLMGATGQDTPDKMVDSFLLDSGGSLIQGDGKYQELQLDQQQLAEANGYLEAEIGHQLYMITYSSCERTGLIRATAMSKSEVLSVATQMIRRVILLAVVAIIALMGISYILMRHMLKRLLVVDAMMGQIEHGKFDVVIPEGGSNDEITRIEKRFNKMASQLQTVLQAAVDKEKSRRDAELRALQAQINPHFLYNTLENMRMQCEIDGYSNIGDSLSALGELFRYSIKWGNHEVPLEMEWNNLKNYIAIMEMRFDDQLKCIIECEPGLEDIVVPKMILQPLVENSFDHGFKKMLPPWLLVIRCYRREQQLIISIEDNGKGIDAERLSEIRDCLEEGRNLSSRKNSGNSIGIVNVRQRIEMICRTGSTLQISSHPDEGTKIEIRIEMEDRL